MVKRTPRRKQMMMMTMIQKATTMQQKKTGYFQHCGAHSCFLGCEQLHAFPPESWMGPVWLGYADAYADLLLPAFPANTRALMGGI
mmetsp:Transcript_15934/g.41888  ORF Transcript_15934/g.41888 Transcript_15934/m.41888 type:complete len:86 (-) Transcript_15934:348-605(-)